MTEPLKVGSTVWVFEHYHGYSRATWREKWVPKVIKGETSRSWLIDTKYGGGTKLPKKRNKERPEYLISESEIDDACYVQDHKYHVRGCIDSVRDASTLRQIAALVGYKPKGEA